MSDLRHISELLADWQQEQGGNVQDAPDLDLDFEFSERHQPRPSVARTVSPKPKPGCGKWPAVLGLIAALVLGYGLGRAITQGPAREQAESDAAAIRALETSAAVNHAYAVSVEASMAALIAQVETLASEQASVTAAYESLVIERDDLELLNRALKNEIEKKAVPQKAPAPKAPAMQQTSAGAWSRDKVAATLTAAAAKYGLDAKQTAWIVDTGVRVAYKESRYQPAVVNASGHAGLFQFSSAWGGDERLDPVWSCYRFVRVYAEGGEAKVRQHWAATW